MKHVIKPTEQGLEIDASVAPDKQQALLAELGKCAGGTCSCPTPQYEKLSSIEMSSGPAGVAIQLTVKPGEQLDVAEIEKCLEHTAREIGG